MKILYCKLGRSIQLPVRKWGTIGGDSEPPILLQKLARRNPEHEFIIIGRNSGHNPQELGFPSNVTNPWTVWNKEMKGRGFDFYREPQSDRHRFRDEAIAMYCEATMPYFEAADGIVSWCGQHGGSNLPIPMTQKGRAGEWTQPQAAFINYASFIVAGINRWRDLNLDKEEVHLNPDVRNYLKCRDLKWPTFQPILSQYVMEKRHKNYRWGDERDPPEGWKWVGNPGHWEGPQRYTYDGLELVGMPSSISPLTDQPGFEERQSFVMIANQAADSPKPSHNRRVIVRDWVLPVIRERGGQIHGNWSATAQSEVGLEINPLPWDRQFDTLQRSLTTFTTPTSGSEWPTLKTWEAMSNGTVIFMHPLYDGQGHNIPTLEQVREGRVDHDPSLKHLAEWLRVESPEQLEKRVAAVCSSPETWKYLATAQRELFERKMEEAQCLTTIERRLGI